MNGPSDQFRALTDRLMSEKRLNQKSLARRGQISQGLLSEIRNGKAPLTRRTADELSNGFPDYADSFDRLVDLFESAESDPYRQALVGAERLLRSGRERQAVGAARRLAGDPMAPADVRLDATWLSAESCAALDDAEAAATLAVEALDSAGDLGLLRKQADAVDRLAQRLMNRRHYDAALRFCGHFLERETSDLTVWRRQGCVLWYAGRLVDGYAAMTTSLQLGENRRRILHMRGQLLADLGRGGLAVADLEEAINLPGTPTSEAYARNGLGRAYALVARRDDAGEQFALAEEITPENAWLHFNKALSHYEWGNEPEAREGFELALVYESPALPIWKSDRARMMVEQLK
jgi:tetratricopeptide (TPR) repeat protein